MGGKTKQWILRAGNAYELNPAAKILVEASLIGPISLRVKVRNAVATVDLRRTLDLNQLAKKSGGVVCEPEQSPGGICKFTELPEMTILLFAFGKAVIMGVRDPDHLDPIVKAIMHFLKKKTRISRLL